MYSFQLDVFRWMEKAFGAEKARDQKTRRDRFLEEALELYQAAGGDEYDARQLVGYVFGRAPGEISQEAGGVAVTLAGLCAACGIEVNECALVELNRCHRKIEQIRAKEAAKPQGSPLPGKTPCEIRWCKSGQPVAVHVNEVMDDGSWRVGICQSCAEILALSEGAEMPDGLVVRDALRAARARQDQNPPST